MNHTLLGLPSVRLRRLMVPSRPTRTTVARGLALEAELLAILAALRAHDIPVLVLKGVPLALRLYGRVGARAMVDNDLLVRPEDVPTAVEILAQLGYEDFDSRPLATSQAFSFQHPMQRAHSTMGKAFVEVHWSAFTPELFDVPIQLQWSRTEVVRVETEDVRVFDPAMTVVHLGAHLVQHYLTEWRIMADLKAAWECWGDTIDPEDFRSLAMMTSTRDVLAWALKTLEFELPSGLETPRTTLFIRVVRPEWLCRGSYLDEYAAMAASAVMVSPREFPRWLLRNALPPLEQMAIIHPSTPRRWLWSKYLTRPARPLVRMLRGRI